MNLEDFRTKAHELVDWIADYLQNVEQYPVKSPVKPKDIYHQIPDKAPENAESMDNIFNDFESIILKGITHWQSPNFYAYFPANNSYPSLLAEMLTAALGTQCMIWDTSPAAAELEEKIMEWLKEALGLPSDWSGVIQDTASTATLAALLSARERYSQFQINEKGFYQQPVFRIYTSDQTHSSIEKAVKIAGFGKENLVYVPSDENFSLKTDELEKAIQKDLKAGFQPICAVATIGSTSSTAIDPLENMALVCKKYNLWLHVDAAFAGTATILPHFRWLIKGLEQADSYVFNPHKWMFTNFDCTAYFVKDEESLVRTFEILPEYLKTKSDHQVNNYRDWGIPLGRRFRALKLWFVLRNMGIKGIQEKVQSHIDLAQWLKEQIENHPHFEVLAPVPLSLVCFRFAPPNIAEDQLNELNALLLEKINATGKVYLTHTKLKERYTLRMVTAQTYVEQKHLEGAWKLIVEQAHSLLNK